MKKLIVLCAAVAAIAIVPASASANPGNWGGWGSSCSHNDNAAAPHFWTHFGSSGCGDTQYCVDTSYLSDPGGPVAGVENATTSNTYDGCSAGATYSGIYSAGYFTPTGTGCNHNPPPNTGCPSPTGGVYVGTDTSGTGATDVGGTASGDGRQRRAPEDRPPAAAPRPAVNETGVRATAAA